VAAEPGFTNRLEVQLTLNSADAAAFDRVASTYYQRRLAIVMFGRVLSAPTIQAGEYRGSAIISGIDPQTAANVIAALSG
jgi:preprotein translocase subunit SecD